MDNTELFAQSQGGAGIENLARTFHISPDQAKAVVKEVLPEMTYGMERNTLSRGGVADLVETIGSPRFAAYAEDPQTLAGPQIREDGNQVLDQVLRSKFNSRRLAARASASTGISSTIIKAMLPYIASILMGSLGKTTQGGLGDILKKLPDLVGGAGGGKSGGGRSFTPQRRSSSRDSGGFDGSPLPIPGEHNIPGGSSGGDNPYADIGDILRRGARGGGSNLSSIIRDLLSGVLGFQSKGVLGWFIRAIVVRYGWSIAKAVIGRLLGIRL